MVDASTISSVNFSEKLKLFFENFKSNENQWGLALLGQIDCSDVKYVEVKTIYELLQEYFHSHGYKEGEIIMHNDIYNLFDEKEQLDLTQYR